MEEFQLEPVAGAELEPFQLEPVQQPWTSQIVPTALRVLPAIAGSVLGNIPGAVGGSVLGEYLAQQYEGQPTNYKQLGLAGALGAIPGMNLGKNLSRAAQVGVRAAEGAGMGGLGTVASNVLEGQPLTEGLPSGLMLGAALGAAGGMGEQWFRNRRQATIGADNVDFRRKANEIPLSERGQVVPDDFFTTGPATGEQFQLIPAREGDVSPARAALDTRIAALMKEQEELKARVEFQKKPEGYQKSFDLPDPLVSRDTMPRMPTTATGEQKRELMRLLATDVNKAADYAAGLRTDAGERAVRSASIGAQLAGAPIPDRTFWQAFTDSFKAGDSTMRTKNPWVLGWEMLGKESSRAVEELGASGAELVKRVRTTYGNWERDLASNLDGPVGLYTMDKKFKLTPQERENLFHVKEGTANPMNNRVAVMRDLITAQQQAVANWAQRAGLTIRDPVTGEMVPWRPRADFMPHFIDWTAVEKDTGRRVRMIEEIRQQEQRITGKPVDKGQAEDIYRRMKLNSKNEYGHLEIARRYSLTGHETDAVKVHAKYMEGALKRLHEVEQFGQKFEIGKNLVAGVGAETGDALSQFMAKRYFEVTMGKDMMGGELNPILQYASNKVRGIQTGLKLSHAVIANAGQGVLTNSVVGFGNMKKAIQEASTLHGKEFGRLAGAAIDQTLRDMNFGAGRSEFASKVLKYSGFTTVEQWNRMVAANAGRVFLHDLTEKLRTGDPTKLDVYKRHLSQLGIDPIDIIRKGYKPALQDELKAAESIITRTQFMIRPQDLPLFWSGPLGSIVSQFSSFGFKAAQAIKQEVLKEATQGNFRPLARLALTAPVVGELIRDAQHVVKGKDLGERSEDPLLSRLADNVAGVGAFGLFYDIVMAGERGELGISRRMLGPTGSDIAAVVGAVGSQDPKILAKALLQNIPFAGPAARIKLFPPEE